MDSELAGQHEISQHDFSLWSLSASLAGLWLSSTVNGLAQIARQSRRLPLAAEITLLAAPKTLLPLPLPPSPWFVLIFRFSLRYSRRYGDSASICLVKHIGRWPLR